jgi:glutathione synthase/RimK-type ligase-like ATP-grasp enzyme
MSALIAIHDEPGSYSNRWIQYCRDHAVDFVAVNCRRSDVIDQIRGVRALLWSWRHRSPEDQLVARQVIAAVERMGVKVFPNALTSWHYDDKIAQKYLLEAVGAPLIPTYVSVDEREAMAWIGKAEFPKVFKLRCGAGSANVVLVRTPNEAVAICRRMFGKGRTTFADGYFSDFQRKISHTRGLKHFLEKLKRAPAWIRRSLRFRRAVPPQRGYVYFQDFLPDNAFDTRVTVIGPRAFGFRRRNRPGDFRASGSGELLYDAESVDLRCVRAAFEVAGRIDGACLAFDFLFDADKEPKIGEISYAFSAAAVYDCLGYWDEDLNWRAGHFWPQDLILQDVLDAVRDKT